MDKVDFSSFGTNFQEKLCFHILEDRAFADRMSEVLKIEYLEQKHLQYFVSQIFKYRDDYNTHPSYEIMEMILISNLSQETETLQALVKNYFAKLKIADQNLIDSAEFVKSKALDFCRKQKVKEALYQAAQLIKTHSFDEIEKIISDSLRAGADSNLGYDFLMDFEERYKDEERTAVPTGWDAFDAILKGGHGRRELGVVIAPTGGGKSQALVALLANAIKNGHNAIYYTLELKETVIGQRFDACLTNISMNVLKEEKENVKQTIQNIPGKLIIKEYPMKSVTISAIKSHLSKVIRQGRNIDIIAVDYGDLLKPIEKRYKSEKRDDLEDIYSGLRAIGQEFDVAVWTASQTNRGGLNCEVIDMDSIADAFSKCFPADFIFTLSRTAEDKARNSGRTFIAKNRNGSDGIVFDIFMDPSAVDIRILGAATNNSPAFQDVKNKEEKLSRLKQLYAEMNKQKEEQKK